MVKLYRVLHIHCQFVMLPSYLEGGLVKATDANFSNKASPVQGGQMSTARGGGRNSVQERIVKIILLMEYYIFRLKKENYGLHKIVLDSNLQNLLYLL